MRQTSKSTHKTLHQTGGDFSSSPGILSMSQLLQSANAKSVNKSTAPQMMIPRGIEARKKVMSHQMAISHSCRFMEMPAHKVVMVGMTKRLTTAAIPMRAIMRLAIIRIRLMSAITHWPKSFPRPKACAR